MALIEKLIALDARTIDRPRVMIAVALAPSPLVVIPLVVINHVLAHVPLEAQPVEDMYVSKRIVMIFRNTL